MQYTFSAQLFVHVNFSDEDFGFLEKSMSEHLDTKFETEIGGWFHGEAIKRRFTHSKEMKFGIREGQ